jgi:hypothetical protein
MREAIPSHHQYAFMAWSSVEKHWTTLPLPFTFMVVFHQSDFMTIFYVLFPPFVLLVPNIPESQTDLLCIHLFICFYAEIISNLQHNPLL